MIADLTTTATLDMWERARLDTEVRELLRESEKGFQAAIVEVAKLYGWKVYHTYDSRRSAPGFPDLVLADGRGRLIVAEVKTQRGRVSKAQEEWLRALAVVPFVETHIWRPRDWHDIVAALS